MRTGRIAPTRKDRIVDVLVELTFFFIVVRLPAGGCSLGMFSHVKSADEVRFMPT